MESVSKATGPTSPGKRAGFKTSLPSASVVSKQDTVAIVHTIEHSSYSARGSAHASRMHSSHNTLVLMQYACGVHAMWEEQRL